MTQNNKFRQWWWTLAVGFVFWNTAYAADAPLDKSLKPDDDEEISNVFRDMGVVQRRAMPKAGRFLFSTFGTFDFSDGPYTNYSIHFNPGIAISDFFEVYANIVPFYVVQARSIVQKVSTYQLIDGNFLTITAARPKFQFGIDLLWAPAYGKDSLGLRKVLRSDTFFKLNVSNITYDTTTGLKFALGIGKTYFIGKSLGLRFCVDYGYIQTVVQDTKSFQGMVLTELGLVVYM
ncbi:hypothetical protein K2X30_02130 [bacterium]|nr:hypothetical protein [bacterium]